MARLSPESRRAQLLAAGRRLWASRPYDAVRPADITAATGTSIGLVYHHFGNKRGFYVATVRDVADDLLRATEPASDDLAAGIGASLSGFVAFVEAEGALLRAVLRGGVGVDPEVGRIAQEVRDVNARRVIDRLGRPATNELVAIVGGWVGFCEAIALDHIERRVLRPDALVALMADALGRLVDA